MSNNDKVNQYSFDKIKILTKAKCKKKCPLYDLSDHTAYYERFASSYFSININFFIKSDFRQKKDK